MCRTDSTDHTDIFGLRKSAKRRKKTKTNRIILTDDELFFFGSILRVNSQKYFKTKSTFA